MKIIKDYPPLFDLIDRAFNVKGKPIIYAWGDVIYNPMGASIDEHLQTHEGAHGRRQGVDPTDWWLQYIEDEQFRLEEEVIAHAAELGSRFSDAENRHARRAALKLVARRLASPIYGKLITPAKARVLLAGAAGAMG